MEYKEYTVMITTEEEKSLSYFAESVSDWMQTIITKQCDVALEEIAAITIKRCLEEKVQIPLTKLEMVDLAYSKGWIITAAERNIPAVGTPAEQPTE